MTIPNGISNGTSNGISNGTTNVGKSDDSSFHIRPFEPVDQDQIGSLWAETLSVASEDPKSNVCNSWFAKRKLGPGFDMNNIYDYYFGEKSVGRGGFWVLETTSVTTGVKTGGGEVQDSVQDDLQHDEKKESHQKEENNNLLPQIIGCVGVIPVAATPENTLATTREPPTSETLKTTKRCELQRLSVHKDFRRRGLALKLLKTVETWASAPENGYNEILLSTLQTNQDAVELYRRNGWEEHGEPIRVNLEESTGLEEHKEVEVVVIHFRKGLV